MWGCILTDYAGQSAFGISYTSMKADSTIHLSQWQYWWWFWFSFLWGFYYLTAAKVIRTRVLKFKPRINTSYRSHGKWGDFLACIVPAIWCFNILANSSFIMRLLEWQYELSLFNVRVRGRQWYWVYKFELRHVMDFVSIPKNIGHDRWVVSFGNVHLVTLDYLYALRFRNHASALKSHWVNSVLPMVKTLWDHTYYIPADRAVVTKQVKALIRALGSPFLRAYGPVLVKGSVTTGFPYPCRGLRRTPISHWLRSYTDMWSTQRPFPIAKQGHALLSQLSPYKFATRQHLGNLRGEFALWGEFCESSTVYVRKTGEVVPPFESGRVARRTETKAGPLCLTRTSVTLHSALNYGVEDFNLLAIRFSKVSCVDSKSVDNTGSFVIKQKRAKAPGLVPIRVLSEELDPLFVAKNYLASAQPGLYSSDLLRSLEIRVDPLLQIQQPSRKKEELMSVQLSRRLLRTQRTLILPAQANLTLITNSYDVVHSWFLPSLGLKMDCVPGRSTHHTFYVDSLGFFYGQCAEICGRYHHHMPVRLCVLPFEHFFIWWQHFGLPRVLGLGSQLSDDPLLVAPKFFW